MVEDINEQASVQEEADKAPIALDPPMPDTEEKSEENTATDAEKNEDTLPKEEVDYERLAAEDLAEIKRLDPAYAPASHLGELPFARRFAELRDLGLSVKEALAASAPRFDRYDDRAHLRAVTPRGTRAPEGTLDRDRMKEAKLLFSGLSESEINALYRRVSMGNAN